MAQGKVKFFNAEKGFGFIETADRGDVFVHRTALETAGISALSDGQEVSFEIVNDKKNGKEKAESLQII